MILPVAELASKLAELMPDRCGAADDLRKLSKSIFLELPETRFELLKRVSIIVNNVAQYCDVTQEPWPSIKKLWDENAISRVE